MGPGMGSDGGNRGVGGYCDVPRPLGFWVGGSGV